MVTLQLDERELRLLLELLDQKITRTEHVGASKHDASSLNNLSQKLAAAEAS